MVSHLPFTNTMLYNVCFPIHHSQSLINWDATDATSLLRSIQELLEEYKTYQHSMLQVDMYSRLQFEYSSLIEQGNYRQQDIEILVSKRNEVIGYEIMGIVGRNYYSLQNNYLYDIFNFFYVSFIINLYYNCLANFLFLRYLIADCLMYVLFHCSQAIYCPYCFK